MKYSETEKIMWALLILFLACINLLMCSRYVSQRVPDAKPSGPRMLTKEKPPAGSDQLNKETEDSAREIGFDDYLAKRTAKSIVESRPVPLGFRFWKDVILKTALATLDELGLREQEKEGATKPKRIATGNSMDNNDKR